MTTEPQTIRAGVAAAKTLADLDILYLEHVGYSIVADDASATFESVSTLLLDFAEEIELAELNPGLT